MYPEHKDEEAIFKAVIKMESSTERKAYLKRACGSDTGLLARVEALLDAHYAKDGFLEAPALEPDVTLENPPAIEGLGKMIGRYKLLELIGEGGMGLVYLAEQKEPVRRQVALKIIKPGMDSKQVISRFGAERQALALLDHANIARVLDAGTTETGRPYFAMEYVKGMSITKYCDRHKLSIEQRLKLFLQVCYGVQHAHQKGIIHRDIKPSNILISVQDDRAVPKIIDFGIAKAIAQPLTEQTVFTRHGQLLGTPEYMSPEQADMSNEDIDTRADLYSLGVVLYELLTGVLPFEHEALEKVGFAELQRILQEEEPPHPSIRLTNLGEEAKKIAERRHTQVVALARRLHRELEWIPLKAMRKDRSRRYRSASELADDIQNYLNGAPLIAGPETAMYRVKKFVRKHAGSVATVLLVAVAIVLGLVISTTMYLRAKEARKQESVARARAEDAEGVAQEQRKLAEQRNEDYRRALYASHIGLANAEYQGGNIGRVQELLKSCPNDLRGWEWNHLQHICDQSIKTLRGHQVWLGQIAVSPAGDRLASGAHDRTVVVWDVATGDELMTLRGHKSGLTAVDYSADGSRILSSSNGGTIMVWDAATGAQILTITEPEHGIASASFSPDGTRIVSGHWAGAVKIWDAATGAELMTLGKHDGGSARGATFSPDGKRVASGGWDKTVKIWDANSGGELMTLRGHESYILDVSFSPDGKTIASCSYDNTIKIWDLESGAERMTLSGHTGPASHVAFSPDGRYLGSAGADNLVKLWDARTGAEVATFRGHSDFVQQVVFSPDGTYLASASADNTIKIWDTTRDRECAALVGHQKPVTSVAFSPDGKQVVSGSRESTTGWELVEVPATLMTLRGEVKIWDVASTTEVITLQGDSGVSATGFSADGKRIVTANVDGTLTIWDATTGANLMTLPGHGRPVFSVAFSPDGKKVVSGCMDSTIKVWDVSKGVEILTLKGHRRPVWAVAFSPDGKRIVSGGLDGKVIVWDASTGTQLMTLRGHPWLVFSVTFSPDGKLIASGGYRTIKIWNAATGAELTTLGGHGNPVFCVAFSLDSKRIVSGGFDRTVRVWDVATGAELMTMRGYTDWVRCIAFSPDGQTVAVSNGHDIELLESAPLPEGYELRRTAKSARAIVDRLYEKHGFYHNVVSELQANKELAEQLRRAALQIANSRRGEDVQKLERESWEVVSSPDKEPNSYGEALSKAKEACTLEPDSWRLVRTLGAAQYRVGAHEDAVATLKRAEKMRVNARGEPDPANTAFLAMALNQLGLTQEARSTLERLRDLREDTSLPVYNRLNVHWEKLTWEAEELFASENSKLSSLWERIEAEKLDEAVLQQVEELRALNDTEIARRMEGLVKWLGRDYYDLAKSHTLGYPEATGFLEKAVRIDPDHAAALNDLAWLRINCPPGQVRDTAKALEEAKKACELTEWKNCHYISTLAAACSEVGDYNSAVKWQQKAVGLLPENERAEWQDNYVERLELYKLGKSYHRGDLWSFSTGKMVAWWKLDESEGNTVPDSSGNGLHGRLVADARIVSDPERGNVLSLDGNGDYVNCGNRSAFDITGSITAAAWVKMAVFNKKHQAVVDKGGYAWELNLAQETAGTAFSGYYGLTGEGYEEWRMVLGVIGVNDGKWHHVAGVYDGIKWCTYVDGKLDTCETGWGSIGASKEPVYIGENSDDMARGWNGLIDDVRIYSYALSEDEIRALYAGQGPGPGEKGEQESQQ